MAKKSRKSKSKSRDRGLRGLSGTPAQHAARYIEYAQEAEAVGKNAFTYSEEGQCQSGAGALLHAAFLTGIAEDAKDNMSAAQRTSADFLPFNKDPILSKAFPAVIKCFIRADRRRPLED